MWRSLVARLLWEQDVGGSNPLAPTCVCLDAWLLCLFKSAIAWCFVLYNVVRLFSGGIRFFSAVVLVPVFVLFPNLGEPRCLS